MLCVYSGARNCVFFCFCNCVLFIAVDVGINNQLSAIYSWVILCRERKWFSLCAQSAVKITAMAVFVFVVLCFDTHFLHPFSFILYKYRQIHKNVKLILSFFGDILGCVMRLDKELVFRNVYPTRAKAVAAIKSGLVLVNGKVVDKPSFAVAETDVLNGGDLPYSAGRGSLKLSHALDFFDINPSGCTCLDVGASTGGFTDVLLKNGAVRVYAVDVGTNQLVPELRMDSRVVSLEQTDIRNLSPLSPVDLIVIDVSFVSLTNIVECLPAWGAKNIIVLIKPQFEVPRDIAAKFNGIIKSSEWHDWSINRVTNAFLDVSFDCVGVTESPVKGGSGNTEFLACFKLKK